jgi:prepilin peptidase CpaA
MPDGLFAYGLLGALAIALLIAAFTDLRRRQIDNWLTIAIAAGAPLFWLASGMALWPDLGWQLLTVVICFTVCTSLFALRQMGGGDVKLLSALALWIQPLWFLRLVIVMALLGGLLTLVLGAVHLARKRPEKLKVPYGVAISMAGLWVLVSQYLPMFQNFARSGGAG